MNFSIIVEELRHKIGKGRLPGDLNIIIHLCFVAELWQEGYYARNKLIPVEQNIFSPGVPLDYHVFFSLSRNYFNIFFSNCYWFFIRYFFRKFSFLIKFCVTAKKAVFTCL